MAMKRTYTSKPGKPVEFDLDEVTFTANTGIPLLALMDLAEAASTDSSSPEGLSAMRQIFSAMLGDQYAAFAKHCLEHGTDPDTLLQILQDVMQDVTNGFPTQPPLPSPGGAQNTMPMLRVISSDGSEREEPLTPQRVKELQAAVARQNQAGARQVEAG
jgi:hypothetical protein